MADPNSDAPMVPEPSGLSRRDFIAGASAVGVGLLASGSMAQADDDNKAPPKRRERPDHHNHHHDQKDDPRPTGIAPSPNGTVVTCDDQSKAFRWTLNNPPTSQPLTTRGTLKASCVAGSANSLKVLVADFDGDVDIIDLNNPTKPMGGNRRVPPAKTEVWSVAMSSDGTRALSGTNGGE